MTPVVDPTVHFGSFDAEATWRPEGLAQLPGGPAVADNGRVSAMDELLAAGCQDGDLLVTAAPMAVALNEALAAAGIRFESRAAPGPPGQAVERRLAQAPVGWLPQVSGWSAAVYAVRPDTAAAVERMGLRPSLPDAEAVARVNSKVWSNSLAQAMGLPGTAAVAHSAEQVRRLAADLGASDSGSAGVVVKDPYGVSGRGTMLLTTPRMLDTVVRHLGRQEIRGARVELLVQPLLDKVFDFSTHLTVDACGEVDLLGHQLVDNEDFAYRGSGPVPRDLADRLDGTAGPAFAGRIGAALHAEGYQGPACVDGMCLRDGSVVPIIEINARRSMGWLNLRLERRARAAGLHSWLRCRSLGVSVEDPVERLLAALLDAAVLFEGERPGVLPLAAGTMTPPRGRVFYAIFARDEEQMRDLDLALHRVLATAEIATAGKPTAGKPAATTAMADVARSG
jgi:hypothetical protein